MANITDAINEFKTAPNGESVRDAFVETMTRVNADNIKISNDYAQVIAVAGQVSTVVTAATTATTKASAAATSATTATTKASAAATSATTATTKATEAASSASTATNKATEAASSASTATNKATAANGSAVAAASSASTATTKATEAASSATAANNSAVAAATSATTAATKANSATTSANAAATSATTASNAAGTATVKANAAATSAEEAALNAAEIASKIDIAPTAAAASAASAASSQAIATTKASEASASAAQAFGYKTDLQVARDAASASEIAAELAEAHAKTSETNAKTSETNAKTSETNAKTSETNAKTSETNSATKASEANVSAVNALASKTAAETAKTQTQSIHDAAVLAMAGTTNLTEINDARRGQASLGTKIDLIDTAISDIRSRTQTAKEYGVRIYDNQSSTTLERILDSIGLVANAAVGTGAVVNDFDTADGWPRRRTVNGYYDETVKKFIVTAAKGEPIFKADGTNGNVWVETERFYVKRTVGVGYIDWSICTQQLPGYNIHSKFKGLDNEELEFGYAAAYEVGTDVNGNPTSISGVNPTNGSHDSLLTLARKLGTRYHMDDSPDIDMIRLMIEIEFAQRSSQTAVGQGICSLNYANAASLAIVAETAVNRVILANAQANLFVVGQTIIIGTTNDANNVANLRKVTAIDVYDTSNKAIAFDGTAVNIAIGNFVSSRMTRTGETDTITASSGTLVNDGKHAVIYRGTENPFGNGWKVVSDVVFDNNPSQIYICRDPRKRVVGMSALTADYKPIGYLTALAEGYATALGYDPNYPSVRLTTAIGGGSTTYFGDYFYRNTVATIGLREVLNGGYFSNGARDGCSYWRLHYALANSNFGVAGRLSFTG